MTRPSRSGSRARSWLGIAALTVAAMLSLARAPVLAAGAQQQTFSAPERAVDALIAASRAGKTAELLNILGPESEKLISSGDAIADRAGRKHFVTDYDASHKLDSQGVDKAVLVVGEEDWPFPIPLVREGSVWRFDTKAGESEILNRRIGRDELDVIAVSRAYVEAQREYAAQDRLGSRKLEYAQHFLSSPHKHDGLYWPARSGEESPLGPLMASARAEGYDGKAAHSKPRPYHGYFYRILTRQGPSCTRRRQELRQRRPHDGRICAGRLSGAIRRFRRHDIHRQSGRHRLRKEPRARHGDDGRQYDGIQSGRDLDDALNRRTGCHDGQSDLGCRQIPEAPAAATEAGYWHQSRLGQAMRARGFAIAL